MAVPGDISISLGSFNRTPTLVAAASASTPRLVNTVGPLAANVLQICPQQSDILTESVLDTLREQFPGMEVRFHANIRVMPQRVLRDIIDFDPQDPYWQQFKRLSDYAQVTSYSAHAGFREKGDMNCLFDQQRRLMDFLGVPVAVEGHYPVRENRFLASDWNEWEAILKSGLPFVVDLSHAAIIANLKRSRNDQLIEAMLSSDLCQEIHISGNNQIADQHVDMTGNEWWWSLIHHRNSKAHVFYEGMFKA